MRLQGTWTDGQTDRVIPIYPPNFVCRGYNDEIVFIEIHFGSKKHFIRSITKKNGAITEGDTIMHGALGNLSFHT